MQTEKASFEAKYLLALKKHRQIKNWRKQTVFTARDLFPGFTDVEAVSKLQFWRRSARHLDLDNPVYFGSKVHWLKLYDRRPILPTLVDKYSVRAWIAENASPDLLNECYGVYERFEDIDFDALPNEFILKATHGWNQNHIVHDKHKMDRKQVARIVNNWLTEPHNKINGEWAYSQIPPRVIAEKYLGDNITDYKFICVSGDPIYMTVTMDRDVDIKHGYRDTTFRPLPITWTATKGLPKDLRKPRHFERMLRVAKKLSQGFPFMRVDFYEGEKAPIFGEITLYPSAGNAWYEPAEWNEAIGNLIDLTMLKDCPHVLKEPPDC